MKRSIHTCLAATSIVAGVSLASAAPPSLEQVTVTATRLPENVLEVPAMISLVNGDDAQARGAVDLRDYAAGVAGVAVQPGGDMGPAGAVVAMQGLAEMDAYLLVVDGVPYGGAFNPATATLDPIRLDRVEVLRGAAPVMYGATSFVGTLNLIHPLAGKQPTWFMTQGGSRSSFRGAMAATLSAGPFAQSLLASAEQRGFSQDRGEFERYHLLWRGGMDTSAGRLHFDIDATSLDQTPYSPHPREGNFLSTRFPRDANVNPSDARQDQDRLQINAGLDSTLGSADWVTTVSVSNTSMHNVRGFLREGFATNGVTVNADGFRQEVRTTDGYLDTHIRHATGKLDWIVGADLLLGRGEQESDNFEYAVLPNGANAPNSSTLHIDESTELEDERNFGGLYGQVIVRPIAPLTLLGGVRLNRTEERRCGEEETGIPGQEIEVCENRSLTRVSGSVGATYAVWREGANSLSFFGDYRNTYKPAAIDFGPEAEAEILAPESTRTWEGGFKLNLADSHIELDANYFKTRFDNLVIRENVGGLPALANAGRSQLQGFEIEAHARPLHDLDVILGYAHHSAKFIDYARLRPGGSLQQLAGNRLELSPEDLASGVISYVPEYGANASLTLRYTGSRFLNKTNTAIAGSFVTVDARVGWQFAGGIGVFADGRNLTNRRDAISESELGDAQFYTLSGRSVMATVEWHRWPFGHRS